ncbi:hypothetical protein GW17_00004526 [Ensete ventricosum]|nr:hypothetical protein GW17_00004526 [Ensete ventricosum]
MVDIVLHFIARRKRLIDESIYYKTAKERIQSFRSPSSEEQPLPPSAGGLEGGAAAPRVELEEAVRGDGGDHGHDQRRGQAADYTAGDLVAEPGVYVAQLRPLEDTDAEQPHQRRLQRRHGGPERGVGGSLGCIQGKQKKSATPPPKSPWRLIRNLN